MSAIAIVRRLNMDLAMVCERLPRRGGAVLATDSPVSSHRYWVTADLPKQGYVHDHRSSV